MSLRMVGEYGPWVYQTRARPRTTQHVPSPRQPILQYSSPLKPFRVGAATVRSYGVRLPRRRGGILHKAGKE